MKAIAIKNYDFTCFEFLYIASLIAQGIEDKKIPDDYRVSIIPCDNGAFDIDFYPSDDKPIHFCS